MSLKRNITKMLVGIMVANTAFANVGLTTFAKDLSTAQNESSQEQAIYVETDGDDLTGDGTKEKPFATIQRAKEKVREMNDNMTGDITVYIGEGDYYLDETIEFNVEDSGSNGYNIIYKSADGVGKARLVGGQTITGWQKCDNSDVDIDLDPTIMDKVYKVKLDPEEYDFNTLYENGDRAIMARTRNYEYDPRFPSYHGEYMWSAGGDCHSLVYKAGDIDQKSIDGLVNAQARGDLDAQVYVWDGGDWDWFTDTIPINSIDTSTRTLRFKQDPNRPELYRAKYPVGHGARYYLQGNLAFLDVPGEYYYNKTTGWLYYYPEEQDGEIGSQEIIAPKMQQILYLKGEDKADLRDEPDPEKQVHHIRFSGLKIEGTEFDDYFTSGWNYSDAGGGIWVHPPEAAGSTNPSFCEQTDRPEYQVGAITLTDTNNITIEACQITNTGLYGVAMYLDNQYNTIKNSSIEHTGYGGITMDGGYPGIGKYNNNHTIFNNEIHDIGEQIGHATGITLMSSGSNNISNCEIFNSPRRAIMMSGWIQRDGSDAKYDPMKDMYTVQNRISNMYIHDCEQDAGEDSAVFNICLLRGEILRRLYGTNDPGEGKYNYYDQILIDNIGAHPSMLDKNTVHGLDLTMGGSGTHMSNIKVTNPQSRTMRIEPTVCDEVFYMDNM
ncbi:MAG: right-handed parallel beta-helix repeat-containing protein, partial [Cellulosilyticaceae bacterium]